MNQQLAIKVSNLSKKYVIGKLKDTSIRTSLSNIFRKSNSKSQTFWALENLSFEINKGDIIGVIGKNGAGKSTLLKILSQITKPTEGKIEINGRIASLLEVGTGFHPELTGRENIYLNGTILGMTRKEVKSKFDEIVAFSGVEKFIDTPVKHYSSGMYVRLAFAVAAHLEPEILIIDEVLAVGDIEFQEKCLGKMKEVAGHGRTVIFVSHSMEAISTLCRKAMILDKGNCSYFGEVQMAIDYYLKMNHREKQHFFINKIAGMNFINEAKITNKTIPIEHSNNIEIIIESKVGFENIFLGVAILNSRKKKVFTTVQKITKSNRVVCTIPGNIILKGEYSLDISSFVPSNVVQYHHDICNFNIVDYTNDFNIYGDDIGNVKIQCEWYES